MSQPNARITRDDIESKFREVQGEVEVIESDAMNYVGLVAVAAVAAVVVVAFVLGRRKGRRTRTIVEVRRF